MRILLASIIILTFWVIPIPASAADGCPSDFYDPAWNYKGEYERTEDGCLWDPAPATCEVTPVFEAGEPTSVNNYRYGVYLYDCHATVGSHHESSIDSETDLGDSQCQTVPYLAVLGQPVPGTGSGHCTPRYVNATHAQPVDSPNVAPVAGAFIIYPCATCPEGVGYTRLGLYQFATYCLQPGDFFVPIGYVESGETRIEYYACNH